MDIDVIHVNGYDYTPPPSDFFDKNIFIDRRKNSKYLLMILAGYKSFLYEDVFSRVKAFTPKDYDICIISSGLFDKTLNRIATENDWSYLSTTENNIPLIQNIVILLHKQAEFIFKMDEDIFVTEGSFETLLKTYYYVEEYGHYKIGFIAPLIPLNTYGHVRLLEKLGLVEIYEETFEPLFYGYNYFSMFNINPDVAKFFWGLNGIVPSIDRMNDAFRIQKMSYSICPIIFNISFILFPRTLWESMGGWNLPLENRSELGIDDVRICQHCLLNSLAMVVAENALVGHFSFSGQTEAMKEYYLTHREIFRFPK